MIALAVSYHQRWSSLKIGTRAMPMTKASKAFPPSMQYPNLKTLAFSADDSQGDHDHEVDTFSILAFGTNL
jgi:hypothetical protein